MDIYHGKTAVITGGASGIGRALGEELGRRGALVVLADLDADLLEEVVASLRGQGCKAEGGALDVTDHEAVREFVDATVSRHGRLDYIFNNAGIAVLGEALDLSIDDWHRILDVNLKGVINGVAAAYPVMAGQGCGHIVNTASVAGLIPLPANIAYVASKFGVVGLSQVLRIEGEKYGVKVSVVCPGVIKTPIYHDIRVLGLERRKNSALRHIGISPQRCARTILRGVEKDRGIIRITAETFILHTLYRASPRLFCSVGGGMIGGYRALVDRLKE